jgi:glycerol kinase
MAKYAAAIDQGTTSTRCMVFDHGGQVVSVTQKEHEQIYPKPGWVEHDAKEIWARTQEVVDEAMQEAGAGADDIAGVGITNQRETSLVWDKTSRSTTRSSGRTRARTSSSTSTRGTVGRPGSRRRSGCPWPPTFRGRRSAGSSTTSTARRSGPIPAICCSATWTPG